MNRDAEFQTRITNPASIIF